MEDPHNGSMVTGLMSQGRVNAIKAWFLSREEGVIRLLYSESDTSEGVCDLATYSPHTTHTTASLVLH